MNAKITIEPFMVQSKLLHVLYSMPYPPQQVVFVQPTFTKTLSLGCRGGGAHVEQVEPLSVASGNKWKQPDNKEVSNMKTAILLLDVRTGHPA